MTTSLHGSPSGLLTSRGDLPHDVARLQLAEGPRPVSCGEAEDPDSEAKSRPRSLARRQPCQHHLRPLPFKCDQILMRLSSYFKNQLSVSCPTIQGNHSHWRQIKLVAGMGASGILTEN